MPMQQTPSTISATLEALRSGRFSVRELTECHLSRISRTDGEIKAWVLVDAERARWESDEADRKFKSGNVTGPLHGIPVGIKDVIDVADWPTAAGSARWRHAVAREDAPCVASLRRAGAILLGKTVTTPYASFDPAPTLNPRFPDRTPGGSSAGSAAAVAAGHCLAALGTQTGGSVLRPASYCGVSGFKPTYGLIQTDGVVPLAPSLDHVGVIAGSVDDIRHVAESLLTKRFGNGDCPPWEGPALMVDPRLNSAWVDAYSNRMFDEIGLKRLRGELPTAEVCLPGDYYEIIRHHRVLMAAEAYAWHASRWRRYPEDYPPCISALLREGAGMESREVLMAQEYRKQLREILVQWWPRGKYLLMPATPSLPPDRSSTGDPKCQSPWSFLGWPTLGVPMTQGGVKGPFSVQLIGLPGSDKLLLEHGLRVEQALVSGD